METETLCTIVVEEIEREMGSEGVRVRCAETMPTLYGTRTLGIRAAGVRD